MKICIPVQRDGAIDHGWGRAERVAVVSVNGGAIESWEEFDVGWGTQHDAGPEGQHHARIARFLQEHGVDAVVADHMGPPMAQMLKQMGITVRLGASGSAREAVLGGTRTN
jgi:predicted Fe-Mo cluster-binding NifX family protein